MPKCLGICFSRSGSQWFIPACGKLSLQCHSLWQNINSIFDGSDIMSAQRWYLFAENGWKLSCNFRLWTIKVGTTILWAREQVPNFTYKKSPKLQLFVTWYMMINFIKWLTMPCVEDYPYSGICSKLLFTLNLDQKLKIWVFWHQTSWCLYVHWLAPKFLNYMNGLLKLAVWMVHLNIVQWS